MAVAAPTPSETAYDPFEMTVPAAGQGDFEPCPPGNHVGTIVALFDVGTHEEDYKGKLKENRVMVVCFELQKQKKDGKHFMLSKSYTMSMGDKANWYKLVTGITARKFKEGEKFTARSMLGTPCMILVTNETKTVDNKEKTYVNIESIGQFPDGFPVPTDYRPPVVWSVYYGTPLPDTSWVPHVYGQSIKAMVEESKEFASGKITFAPEPPKEEPPKGPNDPPF
jgi:hypothetical protein